MEKGKVTERTFYRPLQEIIGKAGGDAVDEIIYKSVPDIIFRLGGHLWILSVKIGQDPKTLKEAFIQYSRHKDETNIRFGIILFLPESVRRVKPEEETVRAAMNTCIPTALIDAGLVKEEIADRPFPQIVDFLQKEILDRLATGRHSYYPLRLVISMLQQQVSEMMADIALKETPLLHIITDRKLLMDLGHLKHDQVEGVARFLASYILMSQILFLRLLATSQPELFPRLLSPISQHKLHAAFEKVLEINYRDIYGIDVLDAIPSEFLKDTFDLIWGLEIERVHHDLPGRIFHELMPSEIRKMLAAFYTRPLAADILAGLSINRSDETVFDAACGSGTILVSAYRRKKELFRKEGKAGNPHKRFSEEEIFGADIMPFAVHLTCANLAAMDVATTIEQTQIMLCDSLKLASGKSYGGGMPEFPYFRTAPTAHTTQGDAYEIQLDKVDTVLMNPPFTKVERGIRNFVDMRYFRNRIGGEVGLWGHFVALADVFLQDEGTFGAVIPINILRGRESKSVRQILFKEWTPLYILKPTLNYGFSEWAEYRDILFIARKQKPSPEHKVKFCLVKYDLTRLTDSDVSTIVKKVKSCNNLRSGNLDIDAHPLSKIWERFSNMMWFCGVTDLHHRDVLIKFFDKFSKKFEQVPRDNVLTGYRPDQGTSKFLFLTRHSDDSRVEQAFLQFTTEGAFSISAESSLRTPYTIEKEALAPSLRTPVGLPTMDITNNHDYIACQSYSEHKRVCRASGFHSPKGYNWRKFWMKVQTELKGKETYLVVARRINPFSPATHHIAFYSDELLSPSDQLNVIKLERSRAKATCTLLNSALFLAQFFLLMEESTGRYVDIRLYDLCEMSFWPSDEMIDTFVKVFERFRKVNFPPLCTQLDSSFYERYDEFWEESRGTNEQQRLWNVLKQPIQPIAQRLEFDFAVLQALGVSISHDELIQIYDVLVKEMILVRGLKRD